MLTLSFLPLEEADLTPAIGDCKRVRCGCEFEGKAPRVAIGSEELSMMTMSKTGLEDGCCLHSLSLSLSPYLFPPLHFLMGLSLSLSLFSLLSSLFSLSLLSSLSLSLSSVSLLSLFSLSLSLSLLSLFSLSSLSLSLSPLSLSLLSLSLYLYLILSFSLYLYLILSLSGVPDNGNEWRKFRVVPRSHPLRSLAFYFV